MRCTSASERTSEMTSEWICFNGFPRYSGGLRVLMEFSSISYVLFFFLAVWRCFSNTLS